MPDDGLRVDLTDERGRRLALPGLRSWLARVAPARARGSVAVALVADARIRALNRQYRHKDTVTDVLSFPVVVSPGLKPRPAGGRRQPRLLGDIVIARGVARRQARAAGHAELV